MGVAQLLRRAQYVVDTDGRKKAVVLDYAVWERLLTELEDLEDAKELRGLRRLKESAIPWQEAKTELRAQGKDV